MRQNYTKINLCAIILVLKIWSQEEERLKNVGLTLILKRTRQQIEGTP